MKEIWKDIEGYEDLYQVSNLGRVRSSCALHARSDEGRANTSGWRLMNPGVNSSGYPLVHLSVNGRATTRGVHRLVAEAFVENPDNKPFVSHIDENPLNSRADNLVWATVRESNTHGTRMQRVISALRGKPIRLTRRQLPLPHVEDMEGERWAPIAGFEGLYEVSNMGRVRSLHPHMRRDPLLHPRARKDGYVHLHLNKGGRMYFRYLHRAVAAAFVSGYKDGYEVNHKDEDKSNNRADNLEWVSKRDNIHYGTRSKRYEQKRGRKVCQYTLDGQLVAEYDSVKGAARSVCVSERNIRTCLKGGRNKAGGFMWKEKNT